jgi:transposase
VTKADRERQIVGLLNRGLSVAEIASQSWVSIKHMRNLVRKILAERMPQPPAEYLVLQVSRLNEALLAS